MDFHEFQESETTKLRLYHLWEEEWKELHPDVDLRGAILHQKLYLLESRPSNKQKLKQAVLRSSQNPEKPQDCEDENLRIKPRQYVFPGKSIPRQGVVKKVSKFGRTFYLIKSCSI